MITVLRHPILAFWRWLMVKTNLIHVESYMQWMSDSFNAMERP